MKKDLPVEFARFSKPSGRAHPREMAATRVAIVELFVRHADVEGVIFLGQFLLLRLLSAEQGRYFCLLLVFLVRILS